MATLSTDADTLVSRVGFAVAMAASAVLVVAVVWGGAVYPGYDHARQFMSELGAAGTLTGPAVNRWGYIPNGVLNTAFCLVAAWVLRHSALALVGCLLLAGNGLGMLGAGVYPCDFECSRSDQSPTAVLHDLSGGLGYLCGILGVGLASLWTWNSQARWLGLLGAAVLIISLVGFNAVVVEVEFKGLYQRMMEAALAAFMLALGWALMHGLRAAPPVRS